MNPNHRPRIRFNLPLLYRSTAGMGTGTIIEASTEELIVVADHAMAQPTFPATIDVESYSGAIFNLCIQTSRPLSVDRHYAWTLADDLTTVTRINILLTELRKSQHISICRDVDVEASDRNNGLARYHLNSVALPNISWGDIDTRASFLGREFALPLLKTGMTGGIEQGAQINKRLALAAAKLNIPMGIGSQRLALDDASYASIYDVKQHAPDLFLIGNIGFAQLMADDYLSLCQRAVDMVQADALAIHLNIIQELVQVEGDRDFSDIMQKIANVVANSRVPVIVKEVGNGIDGKTAASLYEAGVTAIDVGGRGGTSWGYIEGLRSSSPHIQEIGRTFRDWGLTTAQALKQCRAQVPMHVPLVATGGIRDGVMVAKAVGLGAAMVGIGLPLMRAALVNDEEPAAVLERIAHELKIAMYCTNSAKLSELSLAIAADTERM